MVHHGRALRVHTLTCVQKFLAVLYSGLSNCNILTQLVDVEKSPLHLLKTIFEQGLRFKWI